jgi:hypothetical protein
VGACDRANPADESVVKVVEVDRVVTTSLGQREDGRERVFDTMVELGDQATLVAEAPSRSPTKPPPVSIALPAAARNIQRDSIPGERRCQRVADGNQRSRPGRCPCQPP